MALEDLIRAQLDTEFQQPVQNAGVIMSALFLFPSPGTIVRDTTLNNPKPIVLFIHRRHIFDVLHGLPRNQGHIQADLRSFRLANFELRCSPMGKRFHRVSTSQGPLPYI